MSFPTSKERLIPPAGVDVFGERDWWMAAAQRLQRELALSKALEDAMADCIGVEDGQTFEQRAEELIVIEVAYQNEHGTTAILSERPVPETPRECGWFGEGRGKCLLKEGHRDEHTCEHDGRQLRIAMLGLAAVSEAERRAEKTGCVDDTPEHLLKQGVRSGKVPSPPVCPTCKTELAFDGDVCGLCNPVAAP